MFQGAAQAIRRLRGRAAPPAPVYPEQFDAAMDLAPFEGLPRIYLIATTPRCGSHFLGHALAGTGKLGVPLEYLNPANLPFWSARFGIDDPHTILARLITHRTSPSGRFGLKAHWSQFEPHADRALFAPFGGVERAVFLYRRDLLGQAISYLRAAQTGQFISGAARRGADEYDYGAIVARALRIRRQNAAWANYLRNRFDRPVLTVVYEDLVGDPAAGLAAVANFIDPGEAAAPAASPRTQRQSDAASADWRARAARDLRPGDRWLLEQQAW